MASKSAGRCYHRSTPSNRMPRRESTVAVDSFSGLAAKGVVAKNIQKASAIILRTRRGHENGQINHQFAVARKPLILLVRTEGLEPSQPFGQGILSPLRLPFRHVRTVKNIPYPCRCAPRTVNAPA